MASSQSLRNGIQRAPAYPVTASRRQHNRLDLSQRAVDAWLIRENDREALREGYTVSQLLNLSFAGMCLCGEEFFELGSRYRFILDLAALLGTEVEVTAQIVWKRPMDAGLCYVGAVFVKSSAPWLGPEED